MAENIRDRIEQMAQLVMSENDSNNKLEEANKNKAVEPNGLKA